MNIEKCSIEDIYEYTDLQKNDTILYLGGRIDDDNLYPVEYSKYLNSQIKELSPDKIICHNYWYAKQYYDKGILSDDTKIDIVLSYYGYFEEGPRNSINPEKYNNYKNWIKILIDKNPNIVYALYIDDNKNFNNRPSSIYVNDDLFGENYDLNNIKYFERDRRLMFKVPQEEEKKLNGTGGFVTLIKMLESGFNNLHILGFSAFGSDEDQSNFSKYGVNCINTKFHRHYNRYYKNKTYFDLKSSEDQKAEAHILQYLCNDNVLTNLENYSKLKESREQ